MSKVYPKDDHDDSENNCTNEVLLEEDVDNEHARDTQISREENKDGLQLDEVGQQESSEEELADSIIGEQKKLLATDNVLKEENKNMNTEEELKKELIDSDPDDSFSNQEDQEQLDPFSQGFCQKDGFSPFNFFGFMDPPGMGNKNEKNQKEFKEMNKDEISSYIGDAWMKREDVKREIEKLRDCEREQIQNKSVRVGDQVIFKTYDQRMGDYQYLVAGESFMWLEGKFEAFDFTIEPLLSETSHTITTLYKEKRSSPNSGWNQNDRTKFYESEIKIVKNNLAYLHQTQKYPLNLNQPFLIKRPEENRREFEFLIEGSKEKIDISKWVLVDVNENSEDVAVNPLTSYHLSTLINNKFYYLKKDRDSMLTPEKEEGKRIELDVVEKDNTDNPDKAQRRITYDDCYCLFDHKHQFVNISKCYIDRDLLYSNADKGIITTKCISFSEILLQNYFQVQYFPSQSKISFKSKIQFYDQMWDEYKYKFLGYEKEKLTLLNDEYLFEIEKVEKDPIVLTNQPFMLKISSNAKYLQSTPSKIKGMNKIEVSSFDSMNPDSFYFYLHQIKGHSGLSPYDIDKLDSHLKDGRKNMKQKDSDEGSEIEKLTEGYRLMKEYIHLSIWFFRDRQPNKTKGMGNKKMCCFNRKLAIYLNKIYDFKSDLKLLKQRRQELIQKEQDLNITAFRPSYFYSHCCEYILALGCCESQYATSSALKEAKNIITDSQECAEGDNDSRRVMMLIKITNETHRVGSTSSKLTEHNIFEIECFIPFIQYELDKEISHANLSILLGIISNKYRDHRAVWSYDSTNSEAIKYICDKLDQEIGKFEDLDLIEMANKSNIANNEKLQDQIFTKAMFCEGRKQAYFMVQNQNSSLRELMKLLIYSYGFKTGLYTDSSFINKGNEWIIKGFTSSETSPHIKGLLLRLFCNINIPDSHSENLLQTQEDIISKILDVSLETLNSFEDDESVEDLFLLCEILGLIICMLRSTYHSQSILCSLKVNVSLRSLCMLLSKCSEMFILPKPHVFDSTEGVKIYYEDLIRANDAAVHDICHDVDVVMQSYKREIVTKVFQMLNIISEIEKKQKEEQKEGSQGQFPFLQDIIANSCDVDSNNFVNTLQKVIIKWMNFDDEFQISSEIYNFLLYFDTQTVQCGKENLIKKELCQEVSGNEEFKNQVEFFRQKIDQMKSDFTLAKEQNKRQEDLCKTYLEDIYNLISLLVKLHGLCDFEQENQENFLQFINQFVSDCYECLIETIKFSKVAKMMWKFNGYFFTIIWNNQLCDNLHQQLVSEILIQSKIEMLNLDSCNLLKKIASSRGHLFEDKEKLIKQELEPETSKVCGFERNETRNTDKMFDYFVQIIKNNCKTGSQQKIESLNKIVSYWKNQSCVENSSVNIKFSDTNPTFLKSSIDQLNNHIKNPNDTMRNQSIRRFQLLIHKLFFNIEVIDPEDETESYIFHSLILLNEIIDHNIMNHSEIAQMFYTKHATNVLFSLILKEYNSIKCASKMRQFAYILLIKLMKLDITAARRSFRIWTYINDNKRVLERIASLANQFSMIFIDEELSWLVSIDLKETDYQELLLSIEWLTILCQNNKHWQDYLRKQDNSYHNHNIINAIIELLRTSVLRLNHEYVVVLLRAMTKFMTETVNGQNEALSSQYANSTVIKYCIEILKNGFSCEEVEFMKNVNKESSFQIMKNEIDEDQIEPILTRSHLFNLLKQEVLCLINSLLLPTTMHQINPQENYQIINDLMVISYIQFKFYRDESYVSELFDENSKLYKTYNINVGFQCYYLIAQLWGNNGQPNFNCVQKIDTEGAFNQYWRLLKHFYFLINPLKGKLLPISQTGYKSFEKEENLIVKANNFFDGHSSCIEIVMKNGELVKRHFEILSCFLSFTQTEKDNFWLDANLDNSKTAVNSFVPFASDKVDELFIQQEVQNLAICLGEVTKKSNWLTDILRLLILGINFILFFALETHKGKHLDNPKLFGLSYGETKIILNTFGIVILLIFCYITIVQGIIVTKLQGRRSIQQDEKYASGKCSRFLRTCWYMIQKYDKTLQSRSIWCLLLCIGFSIAGVASDYFWFSFTLIYLVIFSPKALEVTSAVWEPRWRIVSTVILSAITLYWFAIVAYVYFGKDFNGVIEESNLTLRRSLVVIFDSWYKFGLGAFLADNGRSAIMQDVEGENKYKIKEARMGFDFAFFFIVPTLLLSILSGIIIDNFGERRSKSDSIQQRQNDQCFICGESSSDLQDFEEHCKFKHNIWDYMYYIGYLRAMKANKRNDYRDIHVYNCLQLNKNDWLPAYRDFVIQEAEKEKPTDILGDIIQDPIEETMNQESNKESKVGEDRDEDKGSNKEISALKEEIKCRNEVLESKINEGNEEIKQIKHEMDGFKNEIKQEIQQMRSLFEEFLSKTKSKAS
ncbi:unnamed protein product [Moneuplotes crassus]|uniref:RyR/IP3R Homology associated domain-containing protein n=1 Tax=Euplotes crassus TaxID=5936 RepID=A0AAD1Y6B6_EUPCR|nr:unnamed protein product [Moneuplotes crassus]